MSDLISLIGAIVRMAWDDAAMARLLGHGDIVVVCPKRNTSSRFLPSLAALAAKIEMFYGTVARQPGRQGQRRRKLP